MKDNALKEDKCTTYRETQFAIFISPARKLNFKFVFVFCFLPLLDNELYCSLDLRHADV